MILHSHAKRVMHAKARKARKVKVGSSRLRLGKQDLAPTHLTSPTCHLHCSCLGPEGHTRGTPSVSGTSLYPHSLKSLPFRPPSQPSPKGIPPWRHPALSSTPPTAHPKGCFTTSLDITKCPLLSTPVRRFFLFLGMLTHSPGFSR